MSNRPDRSELGLRLETALTSPPALTKQDQDPIAGIDEVIELHRVALPGHHPPPHPLPDAVVPPERLAARLTREVQLDIRSQGLESGVEVRATEGR